MFFETPEGTTPLRDYSDLLLSWVQNMGDLNRAEAENISHAQKKYLRSSSQDLSSWFQPKMLQVIHRTMFGEVWAWAGKIRKSITSIGVAPHLIPLYLAEFCREVAFWSKEPIELTFLEKSARIHHRLVQIHPFENGNGRFSRLVADRCLLSWKCSHAIWPDDLHREGTVRKLYIKALKTADQGDYEPLILLMKDFGAKELSLSTFFRENFFRSYLQGLRGLAKVKALLRSGEDPNQISTAGHRCLQLILKAKIETRKKLEYIQLLVEHGAYVDVPDKSRLTPFQIAVDIEEKEIALFLRSKGARSLAPPGLGYMKYYKLFQQFPPNH